MSFHRWDQGFKTRHGDQFSWGKWNAQGSCQAAVIGLHGLGGRLQQYDPVGTRLSTLGIATYAWDQRSQGLDPIVSRQGRVLLIEEMINDLEDFASLVRQDAPDVPILLSGDSMGAQLSLVALARPAIAANFAGALLYAPVIALRQANPPQLKHLLRIAGSLVPQIMVNPKWFVQRDTEKLPLTRDPERQHELDVAPYRLKRFSLRFLAQMGDLIERAQAAGPAVTLPVALFAAGKDLFLDLEQTQDFFAKLGSPDKTLFSYPEAHHDILHDWDRDHVLEDTEKWVRHILAARSEVLSVP